MIVHRRESLENQRRDAQVWVFHLGYERALVAGYSTEERISMTRTG